MPLPLSELSAMSSEAASRARARLEAIPPSGSDDDSLQDALSALEDFIELAVSKVCLWVVYTGDLFFQCSGVDWIMLCDMLHAWGIFDLWVWLSSVAMKVSIQWLLGALVYRKAVRLLDIFEVQRLKIR